MKREVPKSPYQLLGITPEATDQEIEEAFKKAKSVYNPDSLSTYSLYSLKEKENILNNIKEAYETLKDPERRKEYQNKEVQSKPSYYRDPLDINDDVHTPMSEDQDTQESFKITSIAEKSKSYVRLKKPLAVMNTKEPMLSEQYRMFYTKLEEISLRNSHNTYAITSSVQAEGKTITSLNLSYVIAQEFKKKVILVELDLKRPSLLSLFKNPINGGRLLKVMEEGADLEESIVMLKNSSLYFLLVENSIVNSSEVLSFARMKQVIKTLKTEFDYVLVDCPPILSLADMNIISKLVDGLILVVRADKTPKDLVQKAVKSLSAENIVGIVLNGANISYKNYYYHTK